jgi:hypothetical protein
MTQELIRSLLQLLTIRLPRRNFAGAGAISIFTAALTCAANCHLSNAQQPPPDQASSSSATSTSPDKQWEYNGDGIVKAGPTQLVLDLVDLLSGSEAGLAKVVWGPDSKRFALNYSPPHAHHTGYDTVTFYQLRDDKWIALRPLVDEDHAQLVQVAKGQVPKRIPRHAEVVDDRLDARERTDANTAILHASAIWSVKSGWLEASCLFTLRFDDAGNWKIIKTDKMSVSKKQLEKEQ